jgi:hypothetical protein
LNFPYFHVFVPLTILLPLLCALPTMFSWQLSIHLLRPRVLRGSQTKRELARLTKECGLCLGITRNLYFGNIDWTTHSPTGGMKTRWEISDVPCPCLLITPEISDYDETQNLKRLEKSGRGWHFPCGPTKRRLPWVWKSARRDQNGISNIHSRHKDNVMEAVPSANSIQYVGKVSSHLCFFTPTADFGFSSPSPINGHVTGQNGHR